MRPHGPRLIITFPTTVMAMAMEKTCQANGLPGRLIPVPPEISAGCGMCWMAPPLSRDIFLPVMADHDITWEGIYDQT